MTKTIIIEDGLSLYKKTGIGQYTENLCKFLIELGYQVDVKRKPFLEKIQNSIVKRILYILWLNIIFPITIIFNHSNIIIFTNTITPFYKIPNKKYYPVLHDLWSYKSPETVTGAQRKYLEIVLFSVRHNYEKIITVSNTVKNEIVDFFKINEDDVKVIYNYFSFGEKPEFKFSENEVDKLLNKFGINSKKYILSVATLNKRKNIPMLIDAYNKLNTDYKLVLVGSTGNQKFNEISENVIFTGYVSDDELKILYKHAFIYVFPSIYEGFGIPLIDAQSFNIPVVCSNIPIFKEIGNDSILYFDLNIDDLNNKLNMLFNNELLLEQLTEKGNRNILRFNSEIIKEQIHSIFNADNIIRSCND